MKPHIIGMVGGSASGKTTLLRQIRDRFADKVAVISQDNYYRPFEQQPVDPNGRQNFDLPESVHGDELIADLRSLVAGSEISRPVYEFNLGAAVYNAVVRPAPVIVVEGLFVFHYEDLRSMLDFRVYLEAPADVRLARRLRRDTAERGVPHEGVLYQWENHVRPAETLFMEPHRQACHTEVNTLTGSGTESLIAHISIILEQYEGI